MQTTINQNNKITQKWDKFFIHEKNLAIMAALRNYTNNVLHEDKQKTTFQQEIHKVIKTAG